MFRWVASASRRSLPTRSSSSRRTKLHSSPTISSMSTAVTPRTDPVRASAPVGEPTEIAWAALFLTSEKSSFITEGLDHEQSHAPDRTDAVRRGERNPLRLSPLRQDRRRAYRLQPALLGHHGLLGPGGDGRL